MFQQETVIQNMLRQGAFLPCDGQDALAIGLFGKFFYAATLLKVDRVCCRAIGQAAIMAAGERR